ncbi:MAG: AAA family ATPase, partial [Victivallaceae bacterium]|nr:AAA family ATPase [Victivallaceae bacterium]
KYFRLSGPILDTLKYGNIIVIDELDARLHPVLTAEIVKLFNSEETNLNNAQLIFATHDTNLLSRKILRRDQVWFTEKDNSEATDLYSLVEYKLPSGKVRKDASFEQDYIRGRYGAIPFPGDLKTLWSE